MVFCDPKRPTICLPADTLQIRGRDHTHALSHISMPKLDPDFLKLSRECRFDGILREKKQQTAVKGKEGSGEK